MSRHRRPRYGRAIRPRTLPSPNFAQGFSEEFLEWFRRGLWITAQIANPPWTDKQFTERLREKIGILMCPLTGSTAPPDVETAIKVDRRDLVNLMNHASLMLAEMTEPRESDATT